MKAKRKKKLKKITRTQFYKKVENLIKRYGKVRVLVRDGYWKEPCTCLCKSCKTKFDEWSDQGKEPDLRMREITADGNCRVSYKSNGHKHWSDFTRSCFMDDDFDTVPYNTEFNDIKNQLKKTCRLMLDHDHDESFIVQEIQYGKSFSKKIALTVK